MAYPNFFAQETAREISTLVTEHGGPLTIRQVTLAPSAGAANPTPNPPFYQNVVGQGTSASGQPVVALRASSFNGRFIAGDKVTFGSDPTVYSIQSAVTTLTTITLTLTANLVQNVTDGETVNFTFAADALIQAFVSSFPAGLINNTSIMAHDKQVRFLASAISFKPLDTHKVFWLGDQFSIIRVKSLQEAGNVYAYSLQVRR